ncbi:Intersectin-2 [Larimichthys crocea]|uniref:Uncharacterized protein n=1 Tax=Larimichthys crocea TaxID=215358 RepID=A0ACD3QXU8_LARCR|nr:Intersectin-2 [Larimichthys crocea]
MERQRKGGMGACEERGAGQEERGRAGGDLQTQGQKEESRIGAGGCGETFMNVHTCNVNEIHGHTLISTGSMVSQGNKHKQISDRLRDAQSKRRILKAEVDLVNQKRDSTHHRDQHVAASDWQRKLSQLVPEQQRLTEKLRNISLNKLSSVALTSLTGSVTEKGVTCRRLKDQLDTLERETTDKLAQMEQYNKELKELREKQVRQQTVLDDLYRVKEEKLRELQRRREEEMERKRREEEEAARQAKLEQERREREKREKEEEEARQRRLQEEQRARQREEEEREAQARLQAAQEKAQEEERRRREEEEEEAKRKREEEEEERKRKEAEEEEEERRRKKEEQDKGGQQPVDEQTVGEPGWLCGSYRGNRGWFPQSYAEKCLTPSTTEPAPSSPGKKSSPPPPLNTRVPDGEVAGDAIDLAQSDASQSSMPLLARAVSSWSATSETHLSLSFGDVITVLLSFSQGDIISVLQQREDWWLGQLNGTQGWFPKDCVTLETGGSIDVDAFDTCDSAQLEEYVALYTYESPEAGDLTFVEGDVVMVTEREGEWWRGCIGDQTGVFPSNYVRPVEPERSLRQSTSPVAPTLHQLRLSPGQLIVVLAKNSTGWWLGELQARGKKRQRGWFHSSHVKLLGPSSSKSSPSPLPVCQVIAMYDYTAANRDELSFSKGQLISILDKTNP